MAWARVIRAASSQRQCLVSDQQVAGEKEERKQEAAPVLSKGYGFGGGGQEPEIKHAEEKRVRGKTSSKTWPFRRSDGFPNEGCPGLPSPTPSPHLTVALGSSITPPRDCARFSPDPRNPWSRSLGSEN